MAQTLSHGYIKLQDGDKGDTIWDGLETDIQMLNDHTHNGTNSAKLDALSSDAVVDDVLAASWAADGPLFKQTVTVPAGMDVDTINVIFRHASTGTQLFLKTTKVSDTTYDVWINDNAASLKAIYTT